MPSAAPYRQAGDEDYPRRFAVQRRQPGFVLAEARNGGYLVGFAAGMPLRPSTSWWRELTTPLPDEVTAEHAGRTFAAAAVRQRRIQRGDLPHGMPETAQATEIVAVEEVEISMSIEPLSSGAKPSHGALLPSGVHKARMTRLIRRGSCAD